MSKRVDPVVTTKVIYVGNGHPCLKYGEIYEAEPCKPLGTCRRFTLTTNNGYKVDIAFYNVIQANTESIDMVVGHLICDKAEVEDKINEYNEELDMLEEQLITIKNSRRKLLQE